MSEQHKAEIDETRLAADLADDDVFGDLSGVITSAVQGLPAAYREGGVVQVERCYTVGFARAVIAALRDRYQVTPPGRCACPPDECHSAGADGCYFGVGTPPAGSES